MTSDNTFTCSLVREDAPVQYDIGIADVHKILAISLRRDSTSRIDRPSIITCLQLFLTFTP